MDQKRLWSLTVFANSCKFRVCQRGRSHSKWMLTNGWAPRSGPASRSRRWCAELCSLRRRRLGLSFSPISAAAPVGSRKAIWMPQRRLLVATSLPTIRGVDPRCEFYKRVAVGLATPKLSLNTPRRPGSASKISSRQPLEIERIPLPRCLRKASSHP